MFKPTGTERPTRFTRRLPVLLLSVLIVWIAGCTHVNVRLNPPDVLPENRIRNATRADTAPPRVTSTRPADADGYFVGLAISGGGSRSANFAAACMFELQRLGLLDRVDYISCVSGGSLPGAYYCLFDQQWNPGDVQRAMTHPFATDMILTTIQPWNALAMMLTSWDRSDVLARAFQKHLFSDRRGRALTFADLRDDRPRLLINATDLQSGRRFVFTNDAFDELNSDLSKYPIARAVTASAAVPVLLHQVTLRDYSTLFRQYRHLIDGGVTDNLGVVTLVDTYIAHIRQARDAGLADPYPHGAVLLVIDAHTNFDAELSDKGDIGVLEGLAAGAGLTSTALLNRVSSATLAEIIVKYAPDNSTAADIRQQIARLERDGYLLLHDANDHDVRVVHLALSRVNELTDLPFLSFGQRVNNIATYFNIDPTEAYHLYKAAELLVKRKFEPTLAQIADELRRAQSAPVAADAPRSQ
jgi:predicted acylesterase/phospholipase RssA